MFESALKTHTPHHPIEWIQIRTTELSLRDRAKNPVQHRSGDLPRRREMESENAAEETTSSQLSSLLPLSSASPSQQPYVSELLSFTLDRLHKVHSLSLSLFVRSRENIDWIKRIVGAGASPSGCGADPEANARGGSGKLPSIHFRCRCLACHSRGSFCNR